MLARPEVAGEFWIDVGGTFTDCILRLPDGTLRTHKLLSSGRSPLTLWRDAARTFRANSFLGQAPLRYFTGYHFRGAAPGEETSECVVTDFDPARNLLTFDRPLPYGEEGQIGGQLFSDEEAPVAGIRWLLGLRLDQVIGRVRVRLGTTRATNALLERRGARTALVATRGFGDALRIGYQDRPALFELRIDQPPELYETAVELTERLRADGTVLLPLDEHATRETLAALRERGITSLAVCLLHAYRNPAHERRVGEIAAELGFPHVSLSHRVSPLPKFVYRGDTTVLDAYLTPILRDYCRRLAAQLPQAELRFMTSAGSLVGLDDFSGKDAILSGPAGGAVGTARIADRARLTPAFAFDMGGTSTDVSRWDGVAFVRRYETTAAGVSGVRRMRLQTSMLEIETVAAGGGSICWFDGEKTAVGARSAGADPGPACYGRGGPLTVTDLNFYLGRLPGFPFRLDRKAVEARLDELIAAIFTATGRAFDRDGLAAGFLRIANAAMVAPIKTLAASRGDDPRTHTLVAFGGAGGQHACAIARELGMSTILCSPFAGVLSALGIGLATTTHLAEHALVPGEDAEAVLAVLESGLRARFAADGIPPELLETPRRILEMRYQGQDTRLTIPQPRDGEFEAAFAREHRRVFGFAFPGRSVERYAARVELSTRPDPPPGSGAGEQTGLAEPSAQIRAWQGEAGWQNIAVYHRENIVAGTKLAGPCIIVEALATVVVEPGWTAHVTEDNDLRLNWTSVREPAPSERSSQEDTGVHADPVTLELFHQRFTSVAEQMGATLQRTALSTNVKERLDFSCALFDAGGALVANAAHIPVHLGAMEECVRCLLADVPTMRAGEVFITNDPFRGGSHLPDVTVITPFFVAGHAERPRFFTASRAHHAEIGGIAPGSLPANAHTLAQEGVLIRALRYRTEDSGASDEALCSLLLSGPYPTRSVDENLADIHAQIAANQAGANWLAQLVAQRGLPTVEAYAAHLQRTSELRMRAALARLPAGTRHFRDAMDDGTPICVSIALGDDRAVFDFTGSGAVHPGNLNANRAIVASAVVYCLRCLLGEPVPLNSGLLAAVELIIPPDTILDPPNADPARCPAVGGGNVETSQRLVDVIFGALGIVAASQGTMNNLLFGRGAPGAFGYYETIGGGAGAGPDFDGASAVHTHMTNTRLTDPEVLEARYPVLVRDWSIRHGSGGAGLRRGGDGMVREIEFLAELEVSLLTSRRTSPPYGAHGGGNALPGRNRLRRRGEPDFTELPSSGQIRVEPGDVLRVETPGGGGWGA